MTIDVPGSLAITSALDGDTLHVGLVGDLDHLGAEGLETRIESYLPSRPSEVRVRMRRIEFVDSSALAALIRVRTACEAAGARLVLVDPTEVFERMLSLCGLEGCFELGVAGRR